MESSSSPSLSSSAVPITEIVIHHQMQKFEHNRDVDSDDAAKEPKHPDYTKSMNNKSSSTLANTIVSGQSVASSSTRSRNHTSNALPPQASILLPTPKESNVTNTPVDIPLQDLYIDRNPRSHYNPMNEVPISGNNSKDGLQLQQQPPLIVVVPHGTTNTSSHTQTTTESGDVVKSVVMETTSATKTTGVPSSVQENTSSTGMIGTSSESSTLLDEDTVLIQTFMECFGVVPASSISTTTAANTTTTTVASSSNNSVISGGSQTRKNLHGIYVCVRHVNYPIIYGMYSSSSSSSSSSNVTAPHAPHKHEEPFRIHSCRYCYMDETRCGIIARNNYSEQQSPKSIYQILQLVQAYAMNQKMITKLPGSNAAVAATAAGNDSSNNNSSDLLGKDSERSTATIDSIGDYTVSALFLQSNSVDNGKTSTGTTVRMMVPEEITTSTRTANTNTSNPGTNIRKTSRSLASRILVSYRNNYHNIMELSLKRIHQVQNFTIQVYKQQILDYQELIIKLQYDLIQKDQQYQATIKQLRRTIQQDCKVIKTMATQQQDVEYALGLSSQHQTNNIPSSTSGNTIDNDPLLVSMLGMGESSSHSVSTAGTASPNKPVGTNAKMVPFRTRSSMSQSLHQQQPTEATIHESGLEDETETSVATNEIILEHPPPPFSAGSGAAAVATGSEPVPPPASRGALLKLQQNWNRPKLRSRNSNANDELGGMKSSHEIFQSFRGGLLDIPRSPPALIRHDNFNIESDDNDELFRDVNDPTQEHHQQQQRKLNGMKNNKKLMMNSDMLSALQIPSRGLLSRSDSMVIPTNPNANNNNNGDGLTPKNNNNNNVGSMTYNHTLANLLAAKLQQEELDFRTNHGSEYHPIRPMSSPPPLAVSAKPTTNPHHQQQQQLLPSIPMQSPDVKSPSPSNAQQLPMMNITIPAFANDSTMTKRGIHTDTNDNNKNNEFENDTAVDSVDTGVEEDNDNNHTSPDKHGNKFIFSVTGATCHDKFGDEGTYTGTILVTEGLPHGIGKMNYDSGRIYDGEWICGQWHGRGKLLNPNGDSYDGEFFFDARHGHGIYQWDNRDIYVGNFTSDKRHGRGKFSFHNGNVYEGEFCDGLFDGYGKYNFAGGSYEGNWKDGRYNGAGILIYGNTGGKYEGEFRNSVAHGFGTEIMPDGKQRRGVWIDGKPTEYLESN